jgi:potassium efflux system protein
MAQNAGQKQILPFGMPTEQLQQLLVQQQAEVERLKKQSEQLIDEPVRRRTRITELPQVLAQAQLQLVDVNNQLATPAPPNEHPELTAARRIQLVAHRMMLEKEIEKFGKEPLFYNAHADLLPEQGALAKQQFDDATKYLEQIQRAIAQRQESIVQRIVRETQEDLATASDMLKPLAQVNVELASAYHKMIENNALNMSRLKDVRATIEDVDRQYKTAVERVKAVGLTDALGVMLKQQRGDLDGLVAHYKPDPQLKDEIRRLQVESFRLQDQLDEWSDDAVQVQRLLGGNALDEVALKETEPLAKSLITRRRTLTSELNQANDQTFQNLVALDTDQHQLVRRIDEFGKYIDQHVIWIPSAPVLGRGDWRSVVDAGLWFFDPGHWTEAMWEPLRDVARLPLIYIPLCLSLALLFVFHRRLKRIITETGEMARRSRCSLIHPTLNSLLATGLMASLWPMVLAVVGWMLSVTDDKNEFVQAVGHAFLSASLFIAPLELLRHVCRYNGLADAHFDWSERVRKFFGQNVKVFYILAAPLLFIVVVMEHQGNNVWTNSLGRLSAISLFVLVAYFLHLTLNSKGVIFQQMSIRKSNTQAYRLRRFWYLLMVGIPVFLLIAAISGYYYTAYQLGGCLQKSIALMIGMVVIGGVLMRWLLVRRRSMAIDEARKARLAQAASVSTESQPSVAEIAAINLQEKPILDLASVSRQAKEVVVFALGAITVILLWWIWREVLPAVGILSKFELWSVTIGERVKVVTLQDLFYATIAFGVTILMIKNMSGVINLAFLQFSSLDAGARYAATTIFRYLITVVGAVIALSFLNIQWSQYGWLVAAVSVGMGFGLQEIVANFVSGLILLFERPVRVGDVVTIDGTTGIVTRIQMRATTVTNWDHQELIVPNKDFITGKLLNWTLSNQINRLVLNVGVAYGSDTNRVRDLLLKVVTDNPDVLDEPPPTVNFDGFGDSALNFVVRCYLGSIEKRVPAKHELHTAIHETLNENGISMPFPQRDVHIINPNSPTSDK